MPIDSHTLEVLGYRELLSIVENFAQSHSGKAHIRNLLPLTDPKSVQLRLDRLREALQFCSQQGRLGLGDLQDPEPVLERLSIEGQSLSSSEFLTLQEVITAGKEIRRLFSDSRHYPHLVELARDLPILDEALEAIQRVFDPGGEIRDSADPELGPARRSAAQFREKVQEYLHRFLNSAKGKFLIADPFVTIRNDRYVVPLRVEHQREVPGIVHGASSSGATLFLEPMAVVELNNQCVYYREREQHLVEKILRQLSDFLRPARIAIHKLIRLIGEFDALFALAEYAKRFDCRVPQLSQDLNVDIHEAKHPLLLRYLGKEEVVPISLELDAEENVLVISGPNTGGKTVTLKTTGLLGLMAQSGMPVPARHAVFPVFMQVLADIGDQQSLSEHLSTFSAHVLALRRMIDCHVAPSLILLDEAGRGTEAAHGSALGIAALDHFRKKGALVVATTHHHEVKVYAMTTPGIRTASVEIDPETFQPTYQLRLGTSGSSMGLQIAERLGLNTSIIEAARGFVDQRQMQTERLLEELRARIAHIELQTAELQKRRDALEQEKMRLEEEFKEHLKQHAERSARVLREWHREFHEQAQKIIAQAVSQTEAQRLRQKLRRDAELLKQNLQRKIESLEPPAEKSGSAASPLTPGDRARHLVFRKTGTVLEVHAGQVTLEIEGKRLVVTLDQVEKINPEGNVSSPRSVIVNVIEERVGPELNLVGSTVEDALSKADKFLDRAFLSQLSTVRIIHGFGTGKLKAALAEFLRNHPHVLEFQAEGGSTLVRLH